MRIEFVRDEIYETQGPRMGPHFKAGAVVDFPEHIGMRWVRRGHRHLDATPAFLVVTQAETLPTIVAKPAPPTAAPAGPPAPSKPAPHASSKPAASDKKP